MERTEPLEVVLVALEELRENIGRRRENRVENDEVERDDLDREVVGREREYVD